MTDYLPRLPVEAMLTNPLMFVVMANYEAFPPYRCPHIYYEWRANYEKCFYFILFYLNYRQQSHWLKM